MTLRITYPHVASTLALVVALGTGGAYAATSLAKNSVGSSQIRSGAVHSDDLADDAVTGAKVAPHTLTGADIKTSTLGIPAAARVYSSDTQENTGTLTSTLTPYTSVTATAPAAGYFVITAGSTLRAGTANSSVTAEIFVDGDFVGGQYWNAGPGDGVFQSQSMTLTVPVTAGDHPVALEMAEGGTQHSDSYLSQVTVLYVPAGHAGQAPIPD